MFAFCANWNACPGGLRKEKKKKGRKHKRLNKYFFAKRSSWGYFQRNLLNKNLLIMSVFVFHFLVLHPSLSYLFSQPTFLSQVPVICALVVYTMLPVVDWLLLLLVTVRVSSLTDFVCVSVSLPTNYYQLITSSDCFLNDLLYLWRGEYFSFKRKTTRLQERLKDETINIF